MPEMGTIDHPIREIFLLGNCAHFNNEMFQSFYSWCMDINKTLKGNSSIHTTECDKLGGSNNRCKVQLSFTRIQPKKLLANGFSLLMDGKNPEETSTKGTTVAVDVTSPPTEKPTVRPKSSWRFWLRRTCDFGKEGSGKHKWVPKEQQDIVDEDELYSIETMCRQKMYGPGGMPLWLVLLIILLVMIAVSVAFALFWRYYLRKRLMGRSRGDLSSDMGSGWTSAPLSTPSGTSGVMQTTSYHHARPPPLTSAPKASRSNSAERESNLSRVPTAQVRSGQKLSSLIAKELTKRSNSMSKHEPSRS